MVQFVCGPSEMGKTVRSLSQRVQYLEDALRRLQAEVSQTRPDNCFSTNGLLPYRPFHWRNRTVYEGIQVPPDAQAATHWEANRLRDWRWFDHLGDDFRGRPLCRNKEPVVRVFDNT